MALEYAIPAEIGLDSDRLAEAAKLLDDWTTPKGGQAPVPGGAILVGRKGRIVEPQFFGRQGPEAGAEAIRRDGMFLLASITKPITYLAAMILVERGQLNLSDPVMRYLPDFAAHHKDRDTRPAPLYAYFRVAGHAAGQCRTAESACAARRLHQESSGPCAALSAWNWSQLPEHGHADRGRTDSENQWKVDRSVSSRRAV